MLGHQKMAEELLNEKDIKKAMIEKKKILPDLDVYCYDSTGKLRKTMAYLNCDADFVKKTKLSNKVESFFKDCKEETKFDAWLGKKPGAGKEIKFEGKGLTGKSSIFKLYCAAFGGASKLEKLLNEQEKNVKDINRDYFHNKITYKEYNNRITKVLIEKATICIQVVE